MEPKRLSFTIRRKIIRKIIRYEEAEV